jgi:hypothetical protein
MVTEDIVKGNDIWKFHETTKPRSGGLQRTIGMEDAISLSFSVYGRYTEFGALLSRRMDEKPVIQLLRAFPLYSKLTRLMQIQLMVE